MSPFKRFFSGSVAEQAAAVGRVAAFAGAMGRGEAPASAGGGRAGEALDEEDFKDLFTLYNGGRPLSLTVQFLDPEARVPGLSEGDVHKTVRDALREEGLHSRKPQAAELRALVCVHEAAVSILVELRKTLYDPGADASGPATAWRSVSITSHYDDADAVLDTLRERVDGFTEEYLRVNEERGGRPACAADPTP